MLPSYSPGCTPNCYAAQEAGTKTWPFASSAGVHDGVTDEMGKRREFQRQAHGRTSRPPYVDVAAELARREAS